MTDTETTAAPLVPDYAIARAVAATIADIVTAQGAPVFAAVFVGGVGTDWQAPPVYPYAVVGPQNANMERGGTTRDIRVRVAVRGEDYAAKPEPMLGDETGRVFAVGALPQLSALVEAVSDALSHAPLGAPVESISTAYDTEPQAPVETAEITLSLSDEQAFGDSF